MEDMPRTRSEQPMDLDSAAALADLSGRLHRRADPGDRRVARWYASTLALRRLRRWRGYRDELLAGALEQLSPADQAALTAAVEPLRRLVNALEQPTSATP